MLETARGGLNPTTLAEMLDRTRKLTTRPFGVNFIMRPGSVAARSPREFIEQAASAARVVEFFYTDPSAEFVRLVHDRGALASWQVGSREEALIAASAKDTFYGRSHHVGWPEAPHRVLRSAVDAAEALHKEFVAQVVNLEGTQVPVPRFAATVADRTATGEVGAMSLYAGESPRAGRGGGTAAAPASLRLTTQRPLSRASSGVWPAALPTSAASGITPPGSPARIQSISSR
jgi:hypothetical protein